MIKDGSLSGLLSYDANLAQALQFVNSIISATSSTTVTGLNFGSFLYTTAMRHLGGGLGGGGHTAVEATDWVSDSQVVAKRGIVGLRASSGVRLTSHIFSRPGSVTHMHSYDHPILSSMYTTNQPARVSSALYGGFWEPLNTSAARCERDKMRLFNSSNCTNASAPVCQQQLGIALDPSVPLVQLVPVDVYFHGGLLPRGGAESTSFVVGLSGAELGVAGSTHSSTIGYSTSEGTAWASDSSIFAQSASQFAWGTRRVVVTAGAQPGSVSERFSFDVPSHSSVDRRNLAATGAASLTLRGSRFSDSCHTAAVRMPGVASTAAEASEWLSDSSMRALSAASSFSTRRVSLTAGERAGSLSQAVSFDSYLQVRAERGWNGSGYPRNESLVSLAASNASNASELVLVESVNVTNGTGYSIAMRNRPATGAAQVTVYGSAFGTVSYTTRSRMGLTSCEESQWFSDTSMRCRSSDGRLSTRRIAVTSGAQASSVTQANSIDTGTLSLQRRSNMHATGSASITVLGSGFAAASARTGMARVGQSGSEASAWLSETSVVAMAPAAVRGSRRLSMTIAETAASLSGSWSYHAAMISTVQSTGRVQAFNASIQTAIRRGDASIDGVYHGPVPPSALIEVHVALARITLSESQCRHDPGSVLEIDGRVVHCLAGAPQNLTAAIYSGSVLHIPERMTEAAADIAQAESRIARERAAAVARNASGCATRNDCTEGMGVGNLTSLIDAYLSLRRYYDSVEGCSQQYARPAFTAAIRSSVDTLRDVGHPDILPNCTDYFLDFAAVARVQRSATAVETVPPLTLQVGSSRAPQRLGGAVVPCICEREEDCTDNPPMNGAWRRVLRGDSTMEQEVPHDRALVRACSDRVYDDNSTVANAIYVAGSLCESTKWSSASSVQCTLGAAGPAGVAVSVDIVFSTRVQPFFYGPPRDSANIPTNFAMLMR